MDVKEYVEIDDCWVSTDDGEYYVGLLPSVISELGSITYVDQIPMGKVLSKDGVIGVLETEKKGDWPLKSPITGQVTKFNTKLNRKPNLVSDNPIGDGWIVRCKLAGISALVDLGEVKTK